MEENENLEMSLFSSDEPLELNFNDIPDYEEEEEIIDNEGGNEDDESTKKDINKLDEDEDPEKVVEEDEDQEEEGDDDEKNSPNLYSSFASILNEKGLLPSFDLQNSKIESVDDLANVFKSEIETQAKNYILEKIGEKGYDALEKGITLQEYQQYEDSIQTLDTITDDVIEQDIELSKKLIYEDYISQGLSEDRALKLLKKTIDLGDEAIIEEAKESLPSLKKIQDIKLQKVQEERQLQKDKELQLQEKIDNDLKNSIYNKKEFIEGVKASKAFQDQVYNSITKIVSKSPDGIAENKLMRDRRENPIEFDTKLYALYEMTKGFKDFSKINSTIKSKVANDFETILRKSNKFEDSGTPSYLVDNESYDGLGFELVK